MADPIDVPGNRFRVQLDDGQVIEADGSTVTDPDTGLIGPRSLQG